MDYLLLSLAFFPKIVELVLHFNFNDAVCLLFACYYPRVKAIFIVVTVEYYQYLFAEELFHFVTSNKLFGQLFFYSCKSNDVAGLN